MKNKFLKNSQIQTEPKCFSSSNMNYYVYRFISFKLIFFQNGWLFSNYWDFHHYCVNKIFFHMFHGLIYLFGFVKWQSLWFIEIIWIPNVIFDKHWKLRKFVIDCRAKLSFATLGFIKWRSLWFIEMAWVPSVISIGSQQNLIQFIEQSWVL